MPYVLRKQKTRGFKVCKRGTRKCFSKRPLTKRMAKRQMRALYLHERVGGVGGVGGYKKRNGRSRRSHRRNLIGGGILHKCVIDGTEITISTMGGNQNLTVSISYYENDDHGNSYPQNHSFVLPQIYTAENFKNNIQLLAYINSLNVNQDANRNQDLKTKIIRCLMEASPPPPPSSSAWAPPPPPASLSPVQLAQLKVESAIQTFNDLGNLYAQYQVNLRGAQIKLSQDKENAPLKKMVKDLDEKFNKCFEDMKKAQALITSAKKEVEDEIIKART